MTLIMQQNCLQASSPARKGGLKLDIRTVSYIISFLLGHVWLLSADDGDLLTLICFFAAEA